MKTKSQVAGILAVILGFGVAGFAMAAPAVVETGTDSIHFESVFYSECAGENVLFVADTVFDYRRVITPAGDVLYLEPWGEGATGTMTGLETGHTWTRTGVRSPYVYRSMGGEMTMWTFKGLWVSDDGGTSFMEHEWSQVIYDANGELRVDRYDITCWPKG